MGFSIDAGISGLGRHKRKSRAPRPAAMAIKKAPRFAVARPAPAPAPAPVISAPADNPSNTSPDSYNGAPIALPDPAPVIDSAPPPPPPDFSGNWNSGGLTDEDLAFIRRRDYGISGGISGGLGKRKKKKSKVKPLFGTGTWRRVPIRVPGVRLPRPGVPAPSYAPAPGYAVQAPLPMLPPGPGSFPSTSVDPSMLPGPAPSYAPPSYSPSYTGVPDPMYGGDIAPAPSFNAGGSGGAFPGSSYDSGGAYTAPSADPLYDDGTPVQAAPAFSAGLPEEGYSEPTEALYGYQANGVGQLGFSLKKLISRNKNTLKKIGGSIPGAGTLVNAAVDFASGGSSKASPPGFAGPLPQAQHAASVQTAALPAWALPVMLGIAAVAVLRK